MRADVDIFPERRSVAIRGGYRIRNRSAQPLRDRATFAEPSLPSEGVSHVLVNGVPIQVDGVHDTEVRPGLMVEIIQPHELHGEIRPEMGENPGQRRCVGVRIMRDKNVNPGHASSPSNVDHSLRG